MRLRLDFSLDTVEERTRFIEEYFKNIDFAPNQEEIEMAGNYILWGKDASGQSVSKTEDIYIPTRHKTWENNNEESLDEMMEQPKFNEVVFFQIPTKKIRPEFSRSEALRDAPEHVKKTYEELFAQIDKVDLILNYYDEAHGKRKNPPRESLVARFNDQEQLSLRAYANELTQYKYLKMRHELVELRRQQYTLRDSYKPTMLRTVLPQPNFYHSKLGFGDTIDVYPLGLIGHNSSINKIFLEEDLLNPFSFTEKDLKIISDFYWEQKQKKRSKLYFDFCEPNHLFALFNGIFELEDSYAESEDIEEENINQLLCTLRYYQSFAKLEEMHSEILDMKINKKTNRVIQKYINEKYNKSYTENYISTIFRQKILVSIAKAAAYHEEIIGNLWFEENFKECSCCGKIYLLSPHNFVRKSRSKDGFSSTCKWCDKEQRKRRK